MFVIKKIIKRVYKFAPIPIQRLIRKYSLHNKISDTFIYKNDPNVFTSIFRGNYWGSDESRSGAGSTVDKTKTIREKLPVLWHKFEIESFLDVPCGDYNWMKEVNKENIIYIGGDIVSEMVEQNRARYGKRNIFFETLDITKDILPKVDMIFCRECLHHLSYESIFKAVRNFKKSGSKFLLVTTSPLTLSNWDIVNGDFRPLNLRIKPFNFPSPLVKIHERPKGGGTGRDMSMYMYKLDDLKI